MNNLCWLSQITAADKSLVGDKIFLLNRLLRNDFGVIPGFVLKSSVLQEFLENLAIFQFLIPEFSLSSDNSKYELLQSVALKSRCLIMEGKFTEALQTQIDRFARQLDSNYLIVRPSLAIPDYQQQGSFGLVRSRVCLSSKASIVDAVKQVWTDLFSAKSLLYWNKLGIEFEQIRLAVLVQPLENAIASGTIELEKKENISSQQAKILANWGLGHSIHKGEVEPDSYFVDLVTSNIIDCQVGIKTIAYRLSDITDSNDRAIFESNFVPDTEQEKAVLRPDQIKSLIATVKNIIQQKHQLHYFEWILLNDNADTKKNNFLLTQVNYLPSALGQDEPTQSTLQTVLLKGIAAAKGKVTAKVVNYSFLNSDDSNNLSQAILVIKTIQPQDIHLLRNANGVITETGGKNSHSAIIARELGIPAVVAAGATKILNTGDWVTLDGDLGTVSQADSSSSVKTKSDSNLVEYYKNMTTKDVPLATQLMVNLSQHSLIEQATSLPIDGIGLLRGEFMISDLLSKRALHEWLQVDYQEQLLDYLTNTISKFTAQFAPKPIYYRSLDLPLWETKPQNSVIGNRGTYAYLKNSLYFQLELAALKRIVATEQNNIRLILPFVRSIKEWQFCLHLVQQAELTEYPNFQLWIMAEVPSVVFLLPEYIAAGVQGIAIGMNDLTQLILGVDREQEDFAQQGLNSNSLAVEKAVSQLIKTAKAHNLPCSICLSTNMHSGDLIDKLIRWGITSISVEMPNFAETYRIMARAEKRLLLQDYLE